MNAKEARQRTLDGIFDSIKSSCNSGCSHISFSPGEYPEELLRTLEELGYKIYRGYIPKTVSMFGPSMIYGRISW